MNFSFKELVKKDPNGYRYEDRYKDYTSEIEKWCNINRLYIFQEMEKMKIHYWRTFNPMDITVGIAIPLISCPESNKKWLLQWRPVTGRWIANKLSCDKKFNKLVSFCETSLDDSFWLFTIED